MVIKINNMRKFIVIILFYIASGFTFFNMTPEQKVADISKGIAEAIRKGNVNDLSNYFNSTIDLTTPGKEGSFSKAQAAQIVKEFFTKYPPKTFEVKHQGASSDGSNYTIGSLGTPKGKFRTYYLIKNVSGKYYIQQLMFETEK